MLDSTSDPLELAFRAQRKAIKNRRRTKKRQSQALASPPDDASTYYQPVSAAQRQGQQGEARAKRHIEAAGALILQQNLRCRAGEIDLVCLDAGILAFIEVRHRRSSRYGGAAASVTRAKQLRLARAAAYFLPRLSRQYFAGRIPACRFDVIALQAESLVWLKGAFETP